MLISEFCENNIKNHQEIINDTAKIISKIGHLDVPYEPFNCGMDNFNDIIYLNFYTSSTEVAAQILKALPPSTWKKSYLTTELFLTATKDGVKYSVEVSGEFCEVKKVMKPHYEMIPGTCKPVSLGI